MNKMVIIKEVSRARGGSGGEYGVLRIPKKYINKLILMRLATEIDIKEYGITKKVSVMTEETKENMKRRKEKLNIHLEKINKLRNSRKSGEAKK